MNIATLQDNLIAAGISVQSVRLNGLDADVNVKVGNDKISIEFTAGFKATDQQLATIQTEAESCLKLGDNYA